MSRGDALERITTALAAHGSSQRGGKWQCPNPEHGGDRDPSMTVRQVGDRAKVKCFKGCEDRAILAAIGLEVADLFDEPRQRGPGYSVIKEYAYTDEQGRELYRVERRDPKDFRPYHVAGGRKVYGLSGVRLVPYRLPLVIEAVQDGRPVWICEGEKDADAVAEAGQVATTNQGGAKGWRGEYDQWFKDAYVVIVVDRDDAGRKRGTDLLQRLATVAKSVVVVEPAVDEEKADAYDHLVRAGLGLADFIETASSDGVRSVRSVRFPAPETNTSNTSNRGVVAHAREDTPPDPLAGFRDGDWLNVQDFPPVAWAVPGIIPEGLTLFVGPPKAGKSWVLLGMLLALSAAGHALGVIAIEEARRVLYLALEDGDRRMQERCRSLMRGDPIPGRFGYVTRIEPRVGAMGTVEAYLDRFGDAGMVALDTLGKVMPDPKGGETVYSRDYRVGSLLKTAADSRPGLSFVAVHHDRKASTDDFVESVSGTNGLAGAADTIVVLSRKRQSAEALLQVTGRDVIEAEYALKLLDGTWVLDGKTLDDAARMARQRREEGELGEKSRAILDYIAQNPHGVRAKEVATRFGDDAHMYLKRLLEAGRLDKAERGIYLIPLEQLEAS